MAENPPDTNVGNIEYIRKQDAVGAVEFGITLASAINIETGEWKELFQRENDELREAVERIKDIKPADVAPVVHATWYDDGTELGCQCSKCGKTLDDYVRYDMDADIGLVEIPNFCPNCGAIMDAKEE